LVYIALAKAGFQPKTVPLGAAQHKGA
jgi:hypothetical protein